jgi:5-methylcytosine-specific restriction endonuclease McrA
MKIRELYEKVNDGHIISDIELQREIVYDKEKQVLVIDSIVKDIPLPAFYFWKNENGILEVLDGKQRIEAIKNFYQNNFMYERKLWMQTDRDIQDKINETELKDIICEGSEQLKREIFRRINTLGVPLSEYEVLNGLFNGEYLRGLSSYVENDRNAKKVLGQTVRGKAKLSLLRLLGVLRHYSGTEGINEYVKMHQDESFATDQREIMKFINFISDIFDSYNQLPIYFNLSVKYLRDITIWKQNKTVINKRITRYLQSDDAKLTDKAKEIEDIIQAIVKGISVDPKRLFNSDDKKVLMENWNCQGAKYECAICKQYFFPEELQTDHIKPWSKGGRTVLSNAQLLCAACNKNKSNNE